MRESQQDKQNGDFNEMRSNARHQRVVVVATVTAGLTVQAAIKCNRSSQYTHS